MAQGVKFAGCNVSPKNEIPPKAAEGTASVSRHSSAKASTHLIQAVSHCLNQDESSPDSVSAAASICDSIVKEIINKYSTICEVQKSLNWESLYRKFNTLSDEDLLPYLSSLSDMVGSFLQNLDDTQSDFDIDSSNKPFPSLTSIFFAIQRLKAKGPKDEIAQNITNFFATLSDDKLKNIQTKLETLADLTSKDISTLNNEDLCHLILLDTINPLKTLLSNYIVLKIDTSEFKKLIEREFLFDTNPDWQDAFREFLEIANQYKNKITSLQATIMLQQEEKQDLETKLQNLTAKNADTEKKIQSLTKKITLQEENIEDLHSQLSQKYEEYDALNRKNSLLVAERNHLGDERTRSSAQLQELKSQINVLKDQIKEEELTKSNYVVLMGNQEEQIVNLNEKMKLLENQLAQKQKEYEAQHAALQEKDAEIKQKADEINKLKHTIKKFDSTQRATMIAYTNKLTEMKQSLEPLTDELEKTRKIVDDLNAALQEKDNEIHELKRTNVEFQTYISEIEQSLDGLIPELEQVKEKVDVQTLALQQRDAEIAERDAKLQKQADEIQELHEFKASGAEMEQRITNLTDELEKTRKIVDDQTVKINSQYNVIKLLGEERKVLENNLIQAENNLIQADETLRKHIYLSDQNQEMHDTIAERNAELQKQNDVIAERDTALQTKDAEIAEKDAALQQRDAEIAERDAALQKKDDEIAELKKELANQQGSPQKPLSHHGQQAVVFQKLVTKNQTLKTYVSRLKTQLESTLNEHQENKKELEAYTLKNESLSTEKEGTRQQLVEIHDALATKLGKVPTEVLLIEGGKEFKIDTAKNDEISDIILDMIKQLSVERTSRPLSRPGSRGFSSPLPGGGSNPQGPVTSSTKRVDPNTRSGKEVEISSAPDQQAPPTVVASFVFEEPQNKDSSGQNQYPSIVIDALRYGSQDSTDPDKK